MVLVKKKEPVCTLKVKNRYILIPLKILHNMLCQNTKRVPSKGIASMVVIITIENLELNYSYVYETSVHPI